MKKKRVFISGGAGFIGSNVAKYHMDEGDIVTVYDNLSRSGTEKNLEWLKNLKGKLNFINGDIRDYDLLEKSIKGQDIIYHEAGQVAVTTSLTNPKDDFDINALGTFNMLEAFRTQSKDAIFIYASTNKVYGGLEDIKCKLKGDRYEITSKQYKKGINEKRPLDFHSPYGCSKGAGDQYVRDFGRVYNLKTVVFRQSCIYGQRQFGNEDQGWVMHFLKTTLQNNELNLYGDGKQIRDILHVDDLINAYQKAIKNIKVAKGKIYNIGGGIKNTTSLIELINLLESKLKKKINITFSDWREGDQKFFVSDNSLLKKELKWEPKINKDKGVDKLIVWAKEITQVKVSRVGINTLFLIPGKVGGTEIFLRNQILELAKKDLVNKYFIFANIENAKLFKGLPKNFKVIKSRVISSNKIARILWEQFILPFQCSKYKIDLLHSPGYITPLVTPCKKITTIFDLNYHFHPEDFNFLHRFIYKVLIPLGARFSDKILVHSFKSKRDLVRVLGVNEEKIEVIYPGVSPKFNPSLEDPDVKLVMKKYDIKGEFILSNTVSHPHKNLSSLIKAYSLLNTKKIRLPNLVLLGFAGREQQKIDQIIKEGKLEKKVKFTGWVDPKDVPYFYKASKIFVFPSLYEGFGLPLIESMASGVALIASKYSCVPEVVGKGGLIIDTKKPKEIARAMLQLLSRSSSRKRLIKSGLKRSQDFSWSTFGDNLLDLYGRVLQG